jgi:hypothetical protein
MLHITSRPVATQLTVEASAAGSAASSGDGVACCVVAGELLLLVQGHLMLGRLSKRRGRLVACSCTDVAGLFHLFEGTLMGAANLDRMLAMAMYVGGAVSPHQGSVSCSRFGSTGEDVESSGLDYRLQYFSTCS